MQKTIKKVLTEYGPIALVIYLALFAVVISGFMLAFQFGWRPESVTARVGIFTAAYVATRLTQPLRIIATAAMTPVAARIWGKFRARNGTPADATERL